MGQAQGIAYVKHALFGRVELWAVNMAAPRDGLGEPWYPALFCVAGGTTVYECALGRTALAAKEPTSREEAAAAAPELVRRAEEDRAAGGAWGACREPGAEERERPVIAWPAREPGRERTEREWDENRRAEAAGDITAARLLAQPSAPEMRMWSVLAALQEQYQADYVREFKVMAADGWYCGHVDYAWPDKRLVIEVYGGPHYKPALDKKGTRQEDDARRIAEIRAAGWAVMIVRDTELTRRRWAAMVQRVRTFLDTGRDPGPPSGRSRR